MTHVVHDIMKSFQSDFESDKNMLENYQGAFLWLVAPSHTYLSLIGPEHLSELLKSERGLYAMTQSRLSADYYFANVHTEDYVFYYDGEGDNIECITADEARRIWSVTKSAALFNYKQMHGADSIPTSFKVPVKVCCGITYLKEQLAFADSIGDTTLRELLHDFQRNYKLDSTCRVELYKDFTEHSFTFAEVIDETNGGWRVIYNGGILYYNGKWHRHT